MKRELLIAVGAVTIVAAGVVGCSSSEDSSSETTEATTSTSAAPTTSASATPAPGTASSGPGTATVTVDGKALPATSPVVCETAPDTGKFSISIGEPITGVIVGLEQDGSVVHGVGLGEVDGTVLSFTEGVPGNTATATKTDKTYKITGTATGQDKNNQQVSKPFEINATCP